MSLKKLIDVRICELSYESNSGWDVRVRLKMECESDSMPRQELLESDNLCLAIDDDRTTSELIKNAFDMLDNAVKLLDQKKKTIFQHRGMIKEATKFFMETGNSFAAAALQKYLDQTKND